MPLDRFTDRVVVDARVAPRPAESEARQLVSAAYRVLIDLGLRHDRYYLPDAAWSLTSLGPSTKTAGTEPDGAGIGDHDAQDMDQTTPTAGADEEGCGPCVQ
jgi:hypothetical protein